MTDYSSLFSESFRPDLHKCPEVVGWGSVFDLPRFCGRWFKGDFDRCEEHR